MNRLLSQGQAGPLSLLLTLCMSCTASVGSEKGSRSVGPSASPTGQQMGGPGDPGAPGGVPSVPGTAVGPNGEPLPPVTPGPTVLRRLTNEEYRNTLQDLLGLGDQPGGPLVPETRFHGYDNFAAALTVPPTLLEQYQALAQQAVGQADLARLAPCGGAEADCARAFVESFGARAFRRPLSASELEDYLALYTLAAAGASYLQGIAHVVETMLYSPHLLYRFELGVPLAGERHALTPHEVAAQLSYLLTAAPPDEALRIAADASTLGSPTQVEAHARRLLAQPRAQGQLRSLLVQWMGVTGLASLSKDPTLYPEFSPSLRVAMGEETGAFIDSVLWQGDARLSTLYSAPYSWVNTELAALYGLPDPGSQALVRQNLDPSQRAGLLTQLSVLATHAKPGDSAPVKRGVFIREGLFCQALSPPPPSLEVVVPPPDPTLTTRERFAQHSESPACAGCHALIDPLGFGLERYDAIGQYRDEENGKPVDAAGMLTGTDVDGGFTGGVELAAKLSASAQAAACAGLQAQRWVFGRMELPGEAELVGAIVGQLGNSQLDVRELVLAFTRTESFFVRTHQP